MEGFNLYHFKVGSVYDRTMDVHEFVGVKWVKE